ncbi:MAG: hypothetical protein HOK25_07760 [Rhodospirillaceae bacterium]|nr:hypothetical protein [Rhodospirillaceae bacterium]
MNGFGGISAIPLNVRPIFCGGFPVAPRLKHEIRTASSQKLLSNQLLLSCWAMNKPLIPDTLRQYRGKIPSDRVWMYKKVRSAQIIYNNL